jgi:hypothetical protein
MTATHDLTRIANNIATHGISANETAVAMVVHRASTAGVDPVLLAVLSDTSQPEIARERAFGNIATALAATRPATSDQHPMLIAA